MKRVVMIMSMLVGANAMALECVSEFDSNKHIFINELDSKLVSAKITDKVDGSIQPTKVLAGKKSTVAYRVGKVYEVYDQKGIEGQLVLNETFNTPTCRTRICYNNSIAQTKTTAKISFENGGYEYFTCF